MSSAGRVVSSNGCVTKPKGRETGLHSCFVQIRSSSLTGSYVMEMAEQREPYESRGSRTVLGEPGGESPPGHSTPYAVTEKGFTADFIEVKSRGGDGITTPSARTADQTEIALFWYESSPLKWSRIARAVSIKKGLNLWENARLSIWRWRMAT